LEGAGPLYKRSGHLLGARRHEAKVTVALARELAGFVWALLIQVPHRGVIDHALLEHDFCFL